MDLECRKNDARHHGFTFRLFHDQTEARRRPGVDHFDRVAILQHQHALGYQNGGEGRVGNHLLGVGIDYILAVNLDPESYRTRSFSADLGCRHQEVHPFDMDCSDTGPIGDACACVHYHPDDVRFGVRRELLLVARGLHERCRKGTASRGQKRGRDQHCPQSSFHLQFPFPWLEVRPFAREPRT